MKPDRAAALKRIEAINAAAIAANRDLTDDETSEWQQIRQEFIEMEATKTKTPAQPSGNLTAATGPLVATKVRQYSILKAVGLALGDPNVGDAGLEKEMHAELSRDKPSKGIMIPISALFMKTGQDTLSPGTGGVLAQTDQLLVGLLAEVNSAIRLATVLGPLGVNVITVPSTQKVRIPRITTPSKSGFVARDGNAPTIQDMAFDEIDSVPHTLGIGAKLNRSSLIYSLPSMEAIVRNDIGIAVQDGINDAYIHADGTANDPIGLVKALTAGSRIFDDELNAPVYLANLLAFSEHVEAYAEQPDGKRAWFGHPIVFDTFATTPIWSGAQGKSVLDGLTGPPESDTLVESHRCTTVFETLTYKFLCYGDFGSTFVIFYGPGMDLLPNPYHPDVYMSGGIYLRGLLDMDVVFRDVKRLALAPDAGVAEV